AFAPWARPRGFTRFGGFPEGEIEFVFLLLTDVDAVSGTHAFEIPLGELAVVLEGSDAEIDIALALVGMPLVDESLDHANDGRDFLGGAWLDGWRQDIQGGGFDGVLRNQRCREF